MIRLFPAPTYPTHCPACGAENTSEKVVFVGAVTGVDAVCSACQTTYLQTLPTGQFNRFPVVVSADNQCVVVDERGRWLVDLVMRCKVSVERGDEDTCYVLPPKFGRLVDPFIANPNPILLVCLDPCYGHALMMLFNAQRHHEQQPDRPIIAVVPRALVWLVPNYVAEIWLVDLPISALAHRVAGLDVFIEQQLARFQAVSLSRAHIHFDHRTTRFADFTRTQKFNLRQFDKSLIESVPRLTFVLREDRLWLRHGWERWLHKALNRLGFGQQTRPFWARWQAVRYRKLAHHIHQKLPHANIVAVGITNGGQYPIDLGYAVEDQRHMMPISAHQERLWCTQYARSQVVIGVHGSGMLLPTSLAAGFVNLLPPDKLPHYAEDSLMAHDNPIHQTLLGRFLSTNASPRQVAELVVSMLTEFPVWLAEEHERGM